jgi:hypothetical protein
MAAGPLSGDLLVPATAIYSKTDGIVSWRTCMLEQNAWAENIEFPRAGSSGRVVPLRR